MSELQIECLAILVDKGNISIRNFATIMANKKGGKWFNYRLAACKVFQSLENLGYCYGYPIDMYSATDDGRDKINELLPK